MGKVGKYSAKAGNRPKTVSNLYEVTPAMRHRAKTRYLATFLEDSSGRSSPLRSDSVFSTFQKTLKTCPALRGDFAFPPPLPESRENTL